MKRNCIYHAGCPDGFGAVWSVRRAWGDAARYIPRGHEDAFDPAAFAGEEVVFVDISLKNAPLRELARVAGHVLILDHHLSARDHFTGDPELIQLFSEGGHRALFDLEHSGAVLAWQHFHPDSETPELLRYVEDQDLWNWKLPRSDEVNAAIGSHPLEFDVWDGLAARSAEDLAAEGAPIARANRLAIAEALDFAHSVRLGERRVEAVNALHNRANLGHELAKRATFGPPWGLVYRIVGERVDCSIYSTGDFDVSAVAAEYGGGGHRNASGFSVTLDAWRTDFV